MEINYKAIGKRIKIARIKADLTQEQLAERINLSPTHMSNIETGSTKMSFQAIVNIANALSVTLDDLMCDNLVHATVQFKKEIAEILEDCDAYEICVMQHTLTALKHSLRENRMLRSEKEN